MSLKEELKGVIGTKRRFLLLRICDIDPITARKMVNVALGTYNTWCNTDTVFVGLQQRREELALEYKKEAITLLRRDNQLAAVLLEEQIISKMKAEIESGNYELLKLPIAKEVYSKLMNQPNSTPTSLAVINWEQRWQQLVQQGEPSKPVQVIEGVPNARLSEANSSQEAEFTESQSDQEAPPTSPQDTEATEAEGSLEGGLDGQVATRESENNQEPDRSGVTPV